MVTTVARKELREMLRDGRFRTLAVLVLLLSVASFAAGWKQYVDVQRQHLEAQAATRAQWLNLRSKKKRCPASSNA
jgi:ABC-2 type transport system permease protein